MILSRKSHRTGFSLVELLVVILIISLLLTLGAGIMKNISGGNSLGSAVATTEALFDEARAIAVGKGTTAKVLVDIDDPQNEDNYLRRIVVVYQELNPQTGEPEQDKWAVASRGLTLPEKIYFSQEFSKKDPDNSGAKLDEFTLSATKPLFDGKYLEYVFNSEGICTTASKGGVGFVLGSGVRPMGQAPRVTGEAKRDFGGFVVWRNGRTSLFRDNDQIKIPSQVSEF